MGRGRELRERRQRPPPPRRRPKVRRTELNEHHIFPSSRPFYSPEDGDDERVRILCYFWHTLSWHRTFENALPSEVLEVLILAGKSARDMTFRGQTHQQRWNLIREALLRTRQKNDAFFRAQGRGAVRLHLRDEDVEDVDLDFSLFPKREWKDLEFLFGENLRSTLGIHWMLEQVMPATATKATPALRLADLRAIADRCHERVLAHRAARNRQKKIPA